MEADVSISVIIPTYNGEKKILNLLHSLEIQTFNNFETIIVIDGSTDGTKNIILAEKFNLKKIKIIEQKNMGKSIARNRGVDDSNGMLINFYDDDMVLEKDCIEKHARFHDMHKEAILVGNGLRNPINAKNEFSNYLIKTEEKWKEKYNEKFEVTLNNISLTACNLSMSKKIFMEVGGFDQCLFDCEDGDFAIRALKKNIKIYCDRSVSAWHNDFPSLHNYIKRMSQYQNGVKNLLLIHPEYNELPAGTLSFEKYSPLKNLFFFVFRNNLFLNIDAFLNSISFLPQWFNFFIFRIVISAHSEFRLIVNEAYSIKEIILPKKKRRNIVLSLIYRICKLPLVNNKEKLRLFLNLEWIFDILAHEYSYKVFKSLSHPSRIHTMQFILEEIHPSFTVLDIGCNEGELSYKIAEKANKVTGIDRNAIAIENAKAKYKLLNLKFYHADALSYLSKNRNPFDVLILSHIINCFKSPLGFLNQNKEYFRYIYIELNDFERSYLNQYRKYLKMERIYSDREHLNEFDRISFRNIIDKAGLKIIKFEYSYGVQRYLCEVEHNSPYK